MTPKRSILETAADRALDGHEKTTHMSLRIRVSDREVLVRTAEKRGITVNRLIAELIRHACESEKVTT